MASKLTKRDVQVFESLFRLGRARKRQKVRWEEFVLAMTHFGFACGTGGGHSGSVRTFTSPASMGGTTVTLDESKPMPQPPRPGKTCQTT
ncbi:hypothetical protein L226DRAFT_567608 [Lentinus tigrinus ALCF2SS1-7]|uniref:EF-hand domain-containing protein n=1 Tax=Lentinus tigrinus ALCF2SS1-6 TaxID=1328759 RepID=A0A5C2RZR0_9APHY|nr:hypothetical protein L227DRAFT_614462 [Lentinus tigrinus ALCF2SS1-6]RPD79512.1 hypothetical protein L226DRAFT_567608 [Lentinus tigrinus ALCF2SS1-7]